MADVMGIGGVMWWMEVVGVVASLRGGSTKRGIARKTGGNEQGNAEQ
jgi:hypothetical protein